MLAACLRRQLDAELRLFDAGFDMYGAAPPPVERVAAMVRELRPHVVGISTLSCERECMAALAAACKQAAPGCVVAVGGPYPTAEPAGWRDCPHIDYAVLGEGDEVFPELVRRIVAGEPPAGLQGVVGRSGATAFATAKPVADLDALPFPAWDLIDLRRYSDRRYRNQTGLPAHRLYTAISTSRGCPYRCSYCHDVHGKRFRASSPARVLAEIADAVRFGVREIHFVDDIFNFDLPRAQTIFAGIRAAHPRLRLAFPNGLRADRLDQEFAVAAARAGTWYAAVAVETASPRVQRQIRKHLQLDKVQQAIRWLEGAGIRTRSFVMLGFPGETEAEMEATIRYVIDSDTSEASFFNVVPYRGSHLHDLAEAMAPGVADDVTLAPFYSEESFYSRATGRSLSRIRDRAILRFYLSRGRFLKVLWRTPLRFYASRAFLETLGYFGVRALRALVPRRQHAERSSA
ncbi:MAG TPA: radical SAM protein, partial [Planctomycetota bacterium]|nr:radical SAM protein [Planctomycetota bacterium]